MKEGTDDYQKKYEYAAAGNIVKESLLEAKESDKGNLIIKANPEHLSILKQGVDVWNEWRIKNGNVIPNLGEADLREADLREADFFNANLCGTDLSGTDFRGANLCMANLGGANLFNADLGGANLGGKNIRLRTKMLESIFKSKGIEGELVNFYKVENLTIDQLSQVKTLYKAELYPELLEQVKEKYPHLLDKPKEE